MIKDWLNRMFGRTMANAVPDFLDGSPGYLWMGKDGRVRFLRRNTDQCVTPFYVYSEHGPCVQANCQLSWGVWNLEFDAYISDELHCDSFAELLYPALVGPTCSNLILTGQDISGVIAFLQTVLLDHQVYFSLKG